MLRLDETKKNPIVTKEVYLRDLLITQVFEFDRTTLIVSVFNEHGYCLIDRVNGSTERMTKTVSCLGQSSEPDPQLEALNINCTDLKPLPGFDSQRFPYLISRTAQHVNLIDMHQKQTF